MIYMGTNQVPILALGDSLLDGVLYGALQELQALQRHVLERLGDSRVQGAESLGLAQSGLGIDKVLHLLLGLGLGPVAGDVEVLAQDATAHRPGLALLRGLSLLRNGTPPGRRTGTGGQRWWDGRLLETASVG